MQVYFILYVLEDNVEFLSCIFCIISSLVWFLLWYWWGCSKVKLLAKFCKQCFRIPIWPYAKLIVTCWLVLPYFSGAAYVYEHYVRPFFVNPQTINIWYVPRKKDTFAKPDDILTAAEKYIQENGPEAFENLIHRVFPAVKLAYCGIMLSCVFDLLY